jgi:fimbrial chaperone protein
MRGCSLFAFAALLLGSQSAFAGTLSVSPVLVQVPAPAKTSSVTLYNQSEAMLPVQLRLFRWVKHAGADKLVPTTDVVASPPAARLKPGGEYTVRIVRVAKTPVEGEESYRLLVDQIPVPSEMGGTNVRFVVRHSIPVFFSETKAAPPRLSWKANLAEGKLIITARNDGERRVRLSGLTIESTSGTTRSFGEGLSGYVLGKSTARWTANSSSKEFQPGSALTIFARDENGPLQSSAQVEAQ